MNNQTKENNRFDTYRIGGTTYIKDTYLGPKAWKAITDASPGRFIDIIEAKFKDQLLAKKIDISR